MGPLKISHSYIPWTKDHVIYYHIYIWSSHSYIPLTIAYPIHIPWISQLNPSNTLSQAPERWAARRMPRLCSESWSSWWSWWSRGHSFFIVWLMINTSKNGDLMAFHDDLMGFRISLDFKQKNYGIFHGIATRWAPPLTKSPRWRTVRLVKTVGLMNGRYNELVFMGLYTNKHHWGAFTLYNRMMDEFMGRSELETTLFAPKYFWYSNVTSIVISYKNAIWHY